MANHPPPRTLHTRLTDYGRRLIATEIALTSRYFDRLVQWQKLPHDDGGLLHAASVIAGTPASSGESAIAGPAAILLNGNLNHSLDIQSLLSDVRSQMTRDGRVMLVLYSPYAKLAFRILRALGDQDAPMPTTFITATDLASLARLSGFEVTRLEPILHCPIRILGLGSLMNRALRAIPGLRRFGLAAVATLRPIIPSAEKSTLAVVVPARNERGNVQNIIAGLDRVDDFVTEAIFVEGHSTDGTWEEIERQVAAYRGKISIKAMKQPGKGKKDAVRVGFSAATADLVTILDADLTVPPEALRRFYDAWRQGLGDFINGSRLVYPMEDESMRFLNWLGNIFFAKALSFVLGRKIGDSLCGTKLLSRRHYESVRRWRDDFGDFDPFGDFELLFPAAALGLGIVDVPIRYLARIYGTTNISRFRHGFELLRMTLIGLFTIKIGLQPMLRLARERLRIERKPSLRRFYEEAYGKFKDCLDRCPREGMVVEIGSGNGFLKSVIPDATTSDIRPIIGVDERVDARELPFSAGSLRAIFMLNAFHHIPDVERFIREAERCLKTGGHIFIVDQHPGWVGRFVHKYLHHEEFKPTATGWAFESQNKRSDANGALAWIVFHRDLQRFQSLFPNLRVVRYAPHTPLFYWLAGGLKAWTLIPGPLVNAVLAFDRLILKLFPRSASFVDIELERVASGDTKARDSRSA